MVNICIIMSLRLSIMLCLFSKTIVIGFILGPMICQSIDSQLLQHCQAQVPLSGKVIKCNHKVLGYSMPFMILFHLWVILLIVAQTCHCFRSWASQMVKMGVYLSPSGACITPNSLKLGSRYELSGQYQLEFSIFSD